ncbi:hypothetical protein Tco_0127892 [Tanacetum coccineum]
MRESLPSVLDAYAMPDVPGYGSRVHTHDYDRSEALDRSPNSVLSSDPKPLRSGVICADSCVLRKGNKETKPDLPEMGSSWHTHDYDRSEALDRSPNSVLSSDPKPLSKYRPPPPQSILSPGESSYPPKVNRNPFVIHEQLV